LNAFSRKAAEDLDILILMNFKADSLDYPSPVRAGLLAVGEDDLDDKVFKSVFHHVDAAAFVGVLDYRILE
jgi:hypothetical protein